VRGRVTRRTVSLLIRFPDGTKEFRYPGKELVEGDVVWHDGEHYRVVTVTTDERDRVTATVEADSGLGDLLRSEEGAIHLDELMNAG
jgi:hypothetical protein